MNATERVLQVLHESVHEWVFGSIVLHPRMEVLMVTHDIDYHIGRIQKRLRRKVHPGWYLCGIVIAICIVASQYGDTFTKMLTRR